MQMSHQDMKSFCLILVVSIHHERQQTRHCLKLYLAVLVHRLVISLCNSFGRFLSHYRDQRLTLKVNLRTLADALFHSDGKIEDIQDEQSISYSKLKNY